MINFNIQEARKAVQKAYGCNIHATPSITKIVVSACVSRMNGDSKKMDQVQEQLAYIAGQQPALTRARKSIAAFKLREGMKMGYKVTLRGKRAENFLFLLIYTAMPRIVDFRGVSPQGFDGRGNYNLGLKNVNVFMHVRHDLESNFGLNITICTDTGCDDKARLLLSQLNMPFIKPQNN